MPMVARIIGLPGEIVLVRDGMVFIDGQRLEEPYIHEQARYGFGPARVPARHYFVLGDKRNHSFDSSKWKRPWLARHAIIGKVEVTRER